VQAAVAQNPEGSPGLFGPPAIVPDNAPLLDRLIGLTGRDPAWGQTATTDTAPRAQSRHSSGLLPPTFLRRTWKVPIIPNKQWFPAFSALPPRLGRMDTGLAVERALDRYEAAAAEVNGE
jgi:hypothetical protein